MGRSALDNVTWKGNSKNMYKAILEVVPWLFKSTVKKEVNDWLIQNGVEVITEELVIKMFNEKAPKAFLQKVGPKLDAMKTEK